jgi:peptide/nickel transport system permease protein
MLQYIVKRLLSIVAMLAVISIAVFLLFYAVPADPARLTCGKNCTPTIIEANRHALGYDKPIITQYLDFAQGLVHERDFPDDPVIAKNNPQSITHCPAPCLGYSVNQSQLVSTMIGQAFPITASIAIGAFVLWIVCGVGIGVISALKRGSLLERALVGGSLIAYSLPTFFIGLILLDIVSIKYGLAPAAQYTSPFIDPVAWFQGMILPWITLAMVFAALYVRLTRANMLETLSEDYIRTARAKGVPEWAVIVRHAMRAALTPIVTIAGLDLGGVLAGAAITETVFNLNGIGKSGVYAIQQLDLPVIVAVVLLSAFVIVLFNFLVDLLYAFLDPRVTLR